jgi:hypothetical protein
MKLQDDRKHLTGREVERLIAATKGSRNEAFLPLRVRGESSRA